MKKNKRIVTIVGARPQFIKAAVLSRAMKKEGLEEVMVHTGQHYDSVMSEIFFNDLKIPKPAHSLGIGSAGHGEQTGRMLMEIEKILRQEKPDQVVVFGDTNSTLAGALAAAKLSIPLAHVEAGLRSYDKGMPEEINRLISDHLSAILFCPTTMAVKNLQREGIASQAKRGKASANKNRAQAAAPLVINSGDVMYDLALAIWKKIDRAAVLEKYALPSKAFILATIHRVENTDQGKNLKNIIQALNDLAASGIPVFFPIHPRTRKAWQKLVPTGYKKHPYLIIHEPVSYPEMIALEAEARMIITDSGGVQKEGYFFKTPCLIPRRESEWTELLAAGWNVLCRADRKSIFKQALEIYHFSGRRHWKNFFGNGQAAATIARILKNY